MSNAVSDLFFWWLPVVFLSIQWLFFLAVLSLSIYVLILRYRMDHEEQAWASNSERGKLNNPGFSDAATIGGRNFTLLASTRSH
jgi:hypothetical protein